VKKGLIILLILVLAVCIPVIFFGNPGNKKIVEKQKKLLDQMSFVEDYKVSSDGSSVTINVNSSWQAKSESEQIMLVQALQNKLTDINTSYGNKVSIIVLDDLGGKLMQINKYGNLD